MFSILFDVLKVFRVTWELIISTVFFSIHVIEETGGTSYYVQVILRKPQSTLGLSRF